MRLGRRGSSLRTVAFGALDGSRWGVLIETGETLIATRDRAGRERSARSGPLELDGEDWIAGSCRVTPLTAPAAADGAGAPAPWRGEQELCTVTGAFAPEPVARAGTGAGVPAGAGTGAEPVACVGVRCALDGAALEGHGSLRLVAAWFSDAEAAGLVALRRAGAGEHADDTVTGALFDPDRWIASTDPRLSTTYDAAGRPTRTNLELWIEDGDDEYPRRVAGEVAQAGTAGAGVDDGPSGAGAAGEGGADSGADGEGVAVTVVLAPLITHSRGHDGHGLYALATL